MLNHCVAKLHPVNISRKIKFNSISSNRFEKKFLVLLGKNAIPFLKPILDRTDFSFTTIFIFQVKGYQNRIKNLPSNVQVEYLDHPIPNQDTFKSTAKFIDMIARLQSPSYFHFIITGGTSSCFALPEVEITSKDYIHTVKKFYFSGIDIFQLNELRALIDRVKGGKLSQILDDHYVQTNVLSDILTDELHFAGSGPTIPGIKLSELATRIANDHLESLLIPAKLKKLKNKLLSSSKYQNPNHAHNMLSSFSDYCNELLKSFSGQAEFSIVQLMSSSVNLDSKSFADMVRSQYNHARAQSITIWGGELHFQAISVDKQNGRGGRLAAFAFFMSEQFQHIKDAFVIAFATDSQDGTSPRSCYYITNKTYLEISENLRGDIGKYIYNMGEILTSKDYAFPSSPTSINFADIVILVKK